jgi:peptidoglycan-N-acetylglucosamine deacetylase
LKQSQGRGRAMTTVIAVLLAVICALFAVDIVGNVAVSRKIDGLSSDNSEMRSQMKKQREENNKLSSKLDSLQSQYSGLQSQVTKIQQMKLTKSGKMAYITFDDGPSPITSQLLDTLKANGVHATFFVVGTAASERPEIVKRAAAEGNAIGIHSWCHVYSYIYASESNFFEDFNRLREYIKTLTGDYPTVCRYPGGTNETAGNPGHMLRYIDPKVKAMGVKPFDWNAYARDAVSGLRPSPSEIVNYIVKDSSGMSAGTPLVILMHDTGVNGNDVAALPELIKQLKSRGYSFGTLSANTPSVQWKPAQ